MVCAPYVALVVHTADSEGSFKLTPGFSFPQFLDNYSFQASAQFAVSDYNTRPALQNRYRGMRFRAQLDAARELSSQAATLALQWTAARGHGC